MYIRDFDARDVSCPECGAVRWEPCATAHGEQLDPAHFHTGRYHEMAQNLVIQMEHSLVFTLAHYPTGAIVDRTPCPVCPAITGSKCDVRLFTDEDWSAEVHEARISAYCRDLRGDI